MEINYQSTEAINGLNKDIYLDTYSEPWLSLVQFLVIRNTKLNVFTIN